MDKKEFMRQWGVDGMSADKIKLVNAAWEAAILSEREACLSLCDGSPYDEVRDIAEKIRERSNSD